MMHYRNVLAMAFCVVICLSSCSTIELCEEIDHPHQSDMRVRFDFGENSDNKPAKMRILANRLFNTIRYSFVWSTDDEAEGDRLAYLDDRFSDPNRSFYKDELDSEDKEEDLGSDPQEPELNDGEFPVQLDENAVTRADGDESEDLDNDQEGEGEESEEGEKGEDEGGENDEGSEVDEPEEEPAPEPEAPREEDPRGRRLRSGEYQLFTINYDSEVVVDGLESFMTDYDKRMNTLKINNKVHTRSEQINEKFADWTDFNAGFPFVGNMNKLMVDQQTVNVQSGNVTLVISFAPKPITQRINLQWNISKESESIQIDSIHGELSGIITTCTLQNKNMDVDGNHTARILFEGSQTGNQCQAQLDVLGVMNSASSEMRSGPGMLYLAIYASYEGKSRVIYAGVNLHDIIAADPSIKQTEDGKHYVTSQSELTWTITTPLPITVDDFESGEHKEQGVDMWRKDPERENFDIEV